MADDKVQTSLRKINKKLDNLNTTVTNLHNTTYSSRIDNQNDMDRITGTIDDNLDDLLSAVNGQNISDITNLIIRLQRRNTNDLSSAQKDLEAMVTDNTVMNTLDLQNIMKYIQAQNYQYDIILKYVPALYEAIEIMKDNVLSSDNFTKDFVSIVAHKSAKKELDQFNSRAKKLKEKYNIQDLFEEMYLDASIYGEYFLYHVPYKVAFKRLLDRKNASIRVKNESFKATGKVIFESANYYNEHKTDWSNNKDLSTYMENQLGNNSKVFLKLDPYNIIPEAVNEVKSAMEQYHKYTSVSEQFVQEQKNIGSGTPITEEEYYEGTKKTLKYDSINIAQDGFINKSNDNMNMGRDINIKDIPGSVMYKIPRENIIPCYIGDYCLGYFYFTVINDYITKQIVTNSNFNSTINSSKIQETEMDKQNDELIGHIAASIAEQIDANFINTNGNLKEAIFAILRYNDEFNATYGTNEVTVSFLPAEDVHHFYLKLNKKTHRGISDLEKSVVPAMLYALLYLTDVINKVSRSQDKRIYYVKQNVETNVARTLLNVITQIKMGNMGMRQLENMNTIFNVIGKYNDHVIPRSQSGESPIEFEVMQGQQSETPTELMDKMKEAAVNSTDVPYEFTQSINQVDFASRFTMSNSKFLRKVFKRQRVCQDHFSKIFLKLYNFEFNENESSAKIQLPAPAFLTMTNSQQLIENTKNFATSIADMEFNQEQDKQKAVFIKLFVRNYLGSYIDYDNIDQLIEKANQLSQLEDAENANPIEDLGAGEEEY